MPSLHRITKLIDFCYGHRLMNYAGKCRFLHGHNGRIEVDERHATSVAGVWAGGDCVGGKLDLTVQAVEDGKRAAHAIDHALSAPRA